jgi:hypothetical protein
MSTGNNRMNALNTQIFVKFYETHEYVYGYLYEIPLKKNKNIVNKIKSNLSNKKLIKLTLEEFKKCTLGLYGTINNKQLKNELFNNSPVVPMKDTFYKSAIYTVLRMQNSNTGNVVNPLKFKVLSEPPTIGEYEHLLNALDNCESSDPTEKGYQLLTGFSELHKNNVNESRVVTVAYSNKVNELLKLPLARFFYAKRSEFNSNEEWEIYKNIYRVLGDECIPSDDSGDESFVELVLSELPTIGKYIEYEHLLNALDNCESSEPTEKGYQLLTGFDKNNLGDSYKKKYGQATINYSNTVSELLKLQFARFFYDKRSEFNTNEEWQIYKNIYRVLGDQCTPSDYSGGEPLVAIMYTRKRDAQVFGMKLPSYVSGMVSESQCVIEIANDTGKSGHWLHYPFSDGDLQVQKVKSITSLKIPLNFYPEPHIGIDVSRPRYFVFDEKIKRRIDYNFKCVIFGGELFSDTSQGGYLCRVFMPSVVMDKDSSRTQSGGVGKKNKTSVKKVRKHQGIYQKGPKKGTLKTGFRYSGKKTKTGLKIIIKIKTKNKI